MNQFKQAVAIVNTAKVVIDNLGKKGQLREVNYTPFEKYEPRFNHYTNGGFEWTVHPNGTHSLISPWGISNSAQNFRYKPNKDGFDPSGSFDQQLISSLGIQLSTIKKGEHFAVDSDPEFLHPNINPDGTRILDEEGFPVRYIITRHLFNKRVNKVAQFKTGEPANAQDMLQEWTILQQAFKKERAEKVTRRLRPSVWRSVWSEKLLDQPKHIEKILD